MLQVQDTDREERSPGVWEADEGVPTCHLQPGDEREGGRHDI